MRHCTVRSGVTDLGVGGRQQGSDPPTGGGGYQKKCAILEFSKTDPRIQELRDLGLQQTWLDVVDIIGFDAFLAMWRRLDADPSLHAENGGRIEFSIRTYRSYLRYQRNRYIRSLRECGHSVIEIQALVKQQLAEQISARHIDRLSRSTKVGK